MMIPANTLSPKRQRIYGRYIACCVAMLMAYISIATAQETAAIKNPCGDSLFIRLNKLPLVSLTESERRYVEQKKKECSDFESGGSAVKLKIDSLATVPVAAMPPIDSTEKPIERKSDATPEKKVPAKNPAPQPEDFFNGRNLGIMAAIVGAIIALAVVLGGTVKAPFF